jgi:hypothetical protein
MTPELKARVSIDALLVAAGWRVCNVADANIHASMGVAICEVEAEFDANHQSVQALSQATLPRAFSA